MTTTATISTKDAAKEARTALKEAFPGVAFSVTSRQYSGGASLSVSWSDGPTKAEVRPVVDAFRGTDFDSRDDTFVKRNAYAVDSISLHRD